MSSLEGYGMRCRVQQIDGDIEDLEFVGIFRGHGGASMGRLVPLRYRPFVIAGLPLG
jgi:hypothetical protein